jgi:hypothetical protein
MNCYNACMMKKTENNRHTDSFALGEESSNATIQMDAPLWSNSRLVG